MPGRFRSARLPGAVFRERAPDWPGNNPQSLEITGPGGFQVDKAASLAAAML